MKYWLVYLSEHAIVLIDLMALLVITWATVEVCAAIARNAFAHGSNQLLRAIWLRYARWLVAALSLQLAADIIETSISTSWETIARVGSIAVIRTFLNYFLDRDVDSIRARQHEFGVRPGSAQSPSGASRDS